MVLDTFSVLGGWWQVEMFFGVGIIVAASMFWQGRRPEKDRVFFKKKRHYENSLINSWNYREKVIELASDCIVIYPWEDITLKELKEAAKDVNLDINELKHFCRASMGLCRGWTCGSAVGEIFSKLTKSPHE